MADKTSILIFDYVVLAFVLLVSFGIGIFFSFKQRTTQEYVHGGHHMGLWPVSLSMTVSYISAITMQGLPAEVYLYGIEVTFILFAPLGILLVNFLMLPIYYDLKLTSVYEYLEARFESVTLKNFASLLAITSNTLYSGIILFGPAAALESLIGIPTQYNIIAMAVICSSYTSIGGIEAVIWTDVFQAFVMVLGACMIMIIGFLKVDLDTMFEKMSYYDRTQIHTGFSLLQRQSVFILTSLLSVHKISMFCEQSAMIRYTALPTLTQAHLSTVIACVGYVFLQALAILAGIAVLAFYAEQGCDPLALGKVYTSNQIIPYFVITVVNYPGTAGLFVAAIVASTLSSISSAQNSVSIIFWKDILTRLSFIQNATDLKRTVILKLVVLMFGVIIVLVAFGAMWAGGTLLHATTEVLGTIGSPILGLFLLGGSNSFVSAKSAGIAVICCIAFLTWVSMGKLFYGNLWEEPVEIYDKCHLYTNDTTISTDPFIHTTSHYKSMIKETEEKKKFLLNLYSLSSFSYPFVGAFLTFTLGMLMSTIPFLRHSKPVEKIYIFPFLRRYVGTKNAPHKTEQIEETVLISNPSFNGPNELKS